jgi:hypothetical protein
MYRHGLAYPHLASESAYLSGLGRGQLRRYLETGPSFLEGPLPRTCFFQAVSLEEKTRISEVRNGFSLHILNTMSVRVPHDRRPELRKGTGWDALY